MHSFLQVRLLGLRVEWPRPCRRQTAAILGTPRQNPVPAPMAGKRVYESRLP